MFSGEAVGLQINDAVKYVSRELCKTGERAEEILKTYCHISYVRGDDGICANDLANMLTVIEKM